MNNNIITDVRDYPYTNNHTVSIFKAIEVTHKELTTIMLATEPNNLLSFGCYYYEKINDAQATTLPELIYKHEAKHYLNQIKSAPTNSLMLQHAKALLSHFRTLTDSTNPLYNKTVREGINADKVTQVHNLATKAFKLFVTQPDNTTIDVIDYTCSGGFIRVFGSLHVGDNDTITPVNFSMHVDDLFVRSSALVGYFDNAPIIPSTDVLAVAQRQFNYYYGNDKQNSTYGIPVNKDV